jgi:hypothetical protein
MGPPAPPEGAPVARGAGPRPEALAPPYRYSAVARHDNRSGIEALNLWQGVSHRVTSHNDSSVNLAIYKERNTVFQLYLEMDVIKACLAL